MAQFRGVVIGQRGEASRLGGKSSGLTVHCDGWNGGVSVYVDHQEDTGKDHFMVYRTGGSRRKGSDILLAEFEVEG